MGFCFTLNEKKLPPEIGEKPPRNQEVAHRRRGCQPHGESTRQVGTAYHVFTPWDPPKTKRKNHCPVFFLGGKYINLVKDFKKLLKNALAKFAWNGLVITFEDCIQLGRFWLFLRRAYHSRICREFAWLRRVTGNECWNAWKNSFCLATSCVANRIDLDFDSMWSDLSLLRFCHQGKRPRLNRQDCGGLRARRWWWPGGKLVGGIGGGKSSPQKGRIWWREKEKGFL